MGIVCDVHVTDNGFVTDVHVTDNGFMKGVMFFDTFSLVGWKNKLKKFFWFLFLCDLYICSLCNFQIS